MMEDEQIISVLRTGGYLLAGTETPSDVVVDTIDARTFRHPGMPNRHVVRLTPSNLAMSEDAAMGILGFALETSQEQVALRVRQALGFPEWVLVHDPKNASTALALSRELKKEARRAKSKPGKSRIAFDSMGEGISKKTPHFLPSFYEEVARAFIGLGNTAYAASFFGKAREAEQTYALEVDETRRRDAFVEFALAGALTNKVMSDYARDLTKRHGDDLAYTYFYDLCVRRTLGGTPPHVQMVTELRRLMKAAKRKASEEDARFIADIWEAPALTRAAAKYWKIYEKTYIELAKKDARIRGRLLNTFPVPSGRVDGFKAFWIKFLQATGADAGLILPVEEVDPAARVDGSPAAWIAKMIGHRMSNGYAYYRKPTMPDEGFDLVRRMATRLKSDGVEVNFSGSGWHFVVDIDVLDLMLELGIPTTVPVSMDLKLWATPVDGSMERQRELTFIGGDERFEDVLDVAIGQAFGGAEFEAAARGKAGLKLARKKWLDRRLASLEGSAQPSFLTGSAQLISGTSAHTFQEFPAAWEKMKTTSALPSLAKTLRGGFLGEYEWPAAAEAYADLAGPKQDIFVSAVSVFPYLIVYTDRRAIVVGPKGRELEHDFKLPQGRAPSSMRFSQGQLLVVFYDQSWQLVAYWSGNPKHIFPGSYLGWAGPYNILRKDGSMVEGRMALHAGSEEIPDTIGVLSDGESFWRREGWGADQHLIEFDPDSGKEGRKSLPAYFEDRLVDGWRVDLGNSDLYPLPETFKDSLLGYDNGVYGRLTLERDGEYKTIFPNGTRDFFTSSLLRVAGSEDEYASFGDGLTLTRGDDTLDTLPGFPGLRDVSLISLSHHFGHYLRERDAAASAKLRSVSDATVASLLLAALCDTTVTNDAKSELLVSWMEDLEAAAGNMPKVLMSALDSAKGVLRGEARTAEPCFAEVAKALIGCNDTYALGLEGTCEAHADGVRQLALHISTTAPSSPARLTSMLVDSEVWDFFGNLVRGDDYTYYNFSYGEQQAVEPYLQKIGRFFATGESPRGLNWMTLDLTVLLSFPAIVAWLAASPATENAAKILPDFLDMLADSGLLDLPGQMRVFTTHKDAWKAYGVNPEWTIFCAAVDGNRYFANSEYWAGGTMRVLEYAPDGRFKIPKGVLVDDVFECLKWSGASARHVAQLVRERGAYALDADVIRMTADSCGVSKAEAGILWSTFANTNSWEKNFMPKPIRESLGLKVAEVVVARDGLSQMAGRDKCRFFHQAFPENPEDLWDNQPAVVTAFTKAWGEIFGERISLPEEVLSAIRMDLEIWDPRAILMAILRPEAGAFSIIPKFKLESVGDSGRLSCTADQHNPLENLYQFIRVARYLAANRPANDPFLQAIPAALEKWKETVRNKDFMVAARTIFDRVAHDKITETFAKVGPNRSVAGVAYYDDDVAILYPGRGSIEGLVRTAQLLDGKTSKYFELEDICAALQDLMNMGSLVEWIQSNSNEDRFAADPLFSAPKVIKEIEKDLGVSENAAVAFLQILALPHPTRSNVRRWMGWSASTYRRAMAELVERGCVVEAKRSRAGRAHFLDGPWLDLSAPHLPLEEWKVSMYPPETPYGDYLPGVPLGQLYDEAWRRWSSGDKSMF